MISYDINTHNKIHQLIITLNDDTVHVDPAAIAYISGYIDMQAKLPDRKSRMKARFYGEEFYKPSYKGTGKIYLRPTFGEIYQLKLDKQSPLLSRPAKLWACDTTVELCANEQPLLMRYSTGMPAIAQEISGEGNLIFHAPGPVQRLRLDNDKFIAYNQDVLAYSQTLRLTKEKRAKLELGTLDVADKYVHVYRGSGMLYFCPYPNKEYALQSTG